MSKLCPKKQKAYIETLWLLLRVIYWRTHYLPGDVLPSEIPPSKPERLLEVAEAIYRDPMIWEMFEAKRCPDDAEATRHQIIVCIHARVADVLNLSKERVLDGYDGEHATAQAQSDLYNLIRLCQGR